MSHKFRIRFVIHSEILNHAQQDILLAKQTTGRRRFYTISKSFSLIVAHLLNKIDIFVFS